MKNEKTILDEKENAALALAEELPVEETSEPTLQSGEIVPDKEEVIAAFLGGDDEKLFALLQPLGASKEEILAAKEQFIEAARRSLYRKDLAEILSKYDLGVSDIREIPNFAKYAALRANGFSALDAFESANPRLIANGSGKDRSHLTPITSRQGYTGDAPIPENELKLWQSAFPKATLEELTKRYNKAKRN